MMRRHYVIRDHQLKKKLRAVRLSPCCDGLHLKEHSSTARRHRLVKASQPILGLAVSGDDLLFF